MSDIPKTRQPFSSEDVEAVFNTYPERVRNQLLMLRDMIFEIAAETDGVGEIEETLKWGQPSYLTVRPKSGTTIRIDQHKSDPAHYALFVHCQTNLIETISELYPGDLAYEGKRAIIFETDKELPTEILRHCISLALTYHRNKVRKH